ncbi:MAG: hypothetical protein JSS91_08040 [Bacteroidetes bacterium]|nr:hypothetical protein [Bacteroidota bacterium]
MKITILYLIVLVAFFSKPLSAQDFLEVKYSIDEIKKQRENFKNEKVKSIKFDNTIVEIDQSGKFIQQNTNGEFEYYKIYNYTNDNLTSYNAPADMDTYFKYDSNGNVIEAADAGITMIFYYDENNCRIREEIISEEGEDCPFENIIYDGNKIIEIVGFSCCMGFHDRTIFEYSEKGNIININTYTSRCDSDEEVISAFEEYFYNANSNLPYKMKSWREGQDVSEINFEYEYYE